MLVASFDLSLNGSGIAVLGVVGNKVKIFYTRLVDNKKIKTESEKLANIEDELIHVFYKYGEIHSVAREKGFTRFAGTTQKLFKVVGVSDLVAFKWGYPVVSEYPPTTVKKLLTGSGKAEKEEVETAVRGFLVEEQKDIVFESNDISDAVAVGITHLIQLGVELKGE